MHAYRRWALDHAAEYALLFGTPIPGYHAPAEITTPEARAALGAMGQIFVEAYAQGHLQLADTAPPTIRQHAAQRAYDLDQDVPLPALMATLRVWALGHGLIGLELDHHLQPLIGDVDALYDHEMRALLRQFGLGDAV
jgi:hypothetical protein